jgi:tRNA/tmRNA/rRNA uracil-C5-methylase (TrmA/RlmC/RlmD family)
MSKQIKSKDRVKKLGEVYTPLPLVSKMLRKLPQEIWQDPTKTFLDNSCGIGNFLIAVIKLKIVGGSTPLQAISTTYGVDIMQDNVDDCREAILKMAEKQSKQKRTQEWIDAVNKNIVCHDALTYDYKFE